MPGLVLAVEGTRLIGCAWHPRFRSYEVVVHAALGTEILRSLLACERLKRADWPEEALGHGFAVDLKPFGVEASAMDRARVLIAETGEWLSPPAAPERAGREITIEEIIALPYGRPWVTGRIYFDAQLAGLSVETMVDLFYRDYLGRPADPEGLANYCGRIRTGSLSFDGFRRSLVSSHEYGLRRRKTDEAPGAIFSQAIVLGAGREFQTVKKRKAERERRVSLRRLLAREGIDFILEAYRQVCGEAPQSRALLRHLNELRAGRQKLDIIRELCSAPAAFARAIRFVELLEEGAVAPPEERQSRRPEARKVKGGRAEKGAGLAVRADDLLRREGERFLADAYRLILGRGPSAGEAAFCAGELEDGGGKEEILRLLFAERQACGRGASLFTPPLRTQKPGGPDAATLAQERDLARLEASLAPLATEDDIVGFTEPDEEALQTLPFGRGAEAGEGEEGEMGEGALSDSFAQEPDELFNAAPSASAAEASREEYEPFGDPHLLEGALVGRGFHAPESNGKDWWRWTGPGRLARIRVAVARPGRYRVAIWCEKAPPGVLEGLALRSCGKEARVLVNARDGAASLLCEALAPEAGFTGWIDLELRHGPPQESADGRLLGLCIGAIKVEE